MSVIYTKPPRVVIGHITMSLDGRAVPLEAPQRQKYSDTGLDLLGQMDEHGTAVFFDEDTYNAAHRIWPAVLADESTERRNKAFATWIEQIRKIVWGTDLSEGELSWNNSRLSDVDPAAEVTILRPQEVAGNVLVYESAPLLRALLAAGSIDRLQVTVLPEVLGAGPALFEETMPGSSWRLTSTWPTPSAALTLAYDHVTE